MFKQIGAALIASAVLFNAVSPAAAKSLMDIGNHQLFSEKMLPPGEVSENAGTTPGTKDESLSPEQEKALEAFTQAVTTGEKTSITGLFVPSFGGFYVVHPTAGEDGMVSPVEGVLTQFRKPSASGVIGLLAHNYAAGMWFDQFEIGTMLYVIHGDGSNNVYRLTEKVKFQALQGNSVMSDFVDLAKGSTRSADQVYNQVYTGKPHLTLQTCIQKDADLDWGRLFLLAEPIT